MWTIGSTFEMLPVKFCPWWVLNSLENLACIEFHSEFFLLRSVEENSATQVEKHGFVSSVYGTF